MKRYSMEHKILWLSDFDIIGSGFMNISVPLCAGLSQIGYDVKAIGMGYKGQQHTYPFSIFPTNNFQEADVIAKNLGLLWQYDTMVVAMDIYIHEAILKNFPSKNFKYIGIFPIESDPLCMSWASVLFGMNKSLVISEFGTQEAIRMGIDAEHLMVGIDTNAWRIPTPDERKRVRTSMFGVDDDTFIVLTVADNQERKNLAAAMEIFREFQQSLNGRKALYVLVTREHNLVGWKLRDLAQEYGISDKFMLYERGMPFTQLWMLYAGADVFLLTSKAEGRGMPVLEAMACGLPCIATDCTGMKESLENDRGILIPYEYTHRDPFGNGQRYWINKHLAADALYKLANGILNVDTTKARKYVESLNWNDSILHLDRVIKKLHGEEINEDRSNS